MAGCTKWLLTLAMLTSMASCDSVDDQRIPAMPVRITFRTEAEWITHGVPGACDYRCFVKPLRIPSSFPYTALDETGYGGVMVIGDINGDFTAVDMSCPVESRPDIRIFVPEGKLYAECPECGSTYEIFSNTGMPRSGMAAEQKYALTLYHVHMGGPGEYRVVTR